MVLALAALMIMVGLAFKLSAVPFHFWCPDVFEGASAEVDAFLSVASKGAAMALLVRVALGVTSPPARPLQRPRDPRPNATSPPKPSRYFNEAERRRPLAAETAPATATQAPARPRPHVHRPPARRRRRGHLHVRQPGRLRPNEHQAAAGLFDDRPRRLHDDGRRRGRATGGHQRGRRREAVAALVFYLAVYVFMNLGAFAIVAFLRNAIGSEEIADYAGLIRSAPVTGVALTTILVSLIGLPPLAGFIGKFSCSPRWSTPAARG